MDVILFLGLCHPWAAYLVSFPCSWPSSHMYTIALEKEQNGDKESDTGNKSFKSEAQSKRAFVGFIFLQCKSSFSTCTSNGEALRRTHRLLRFYNEICLVFFYENEMCLVLPMQISAGGVRICEVHLGGNTPRESPQKLQR
jgi:hypothetical protein